MPQRKESAKKRKIPRDRRILMKQRQKLKKRMSCPEARNHRRIKNELANIEEKIAASHRAESENQEKRALKAIKKNSKYFFTYARSKSTIKTSIGPFMSGNDQIEDPREKAELLRKQFESVFTISQDNISEQESVRNGPYLNDIIFTEENIVNSMKELRPNAAAGPDEIPAILLKNCAIALKSPLYIIWKTSINMGEIPKILKTGLVSPIYKGGDRSEPKNYRPVSLTSHVTKIFEKIVAKNISNFLNENDLYNEDQHGFRDGRSCLSQLLAHQNNIIEGLEDGLDVDVIYLDFAKAFDKVHHIILTNKLKKIGIGDKLLKWIEAFLINRTQYITVEGALSRESNVTSGVPQGTVLGPLLFLIHISDINNEVRNSHVTSFADDTRILKTIKDPNDRIMLQNDLEIIYEWSRKNKMEFNDSKFEMINYFQRCDEQLISSYSAPDGSNICQKNELKDLGILLNNDATFTGNISAKVASSKRVAAWILRTFVSRDKLTMLTLLKSLVIPQIEYCCQLWNPYRICDIQNIECIQKSFTKKISGMNNLNYWQRLKALNLYSLERRRERYIIIYVWKIINELVPNIESRNKISTTHPTRFGKKCAIPPLKNSSMCRIKTCKDNSFFVKGPKLFNCLPSELRDYKGKADSFKHQLDKYLLTVPDQPGFHDPVYTRRAESNSLLHQVELMQQDVIRGGFASSLSRR